jgi:MFS family permease
MGAFATSLGIPALAVPFLLAAAAYTVAGVVVFFWLHPDPLLLATAINAQDKAAAASASDVPSRPAPPVNSRGVTVGATVMVLTRIAMVAIMTMTPVHMQSHGHRLPEVGVVIGIHIGFMYLPSLVTGMLVDKLGRVPLAVAAGLTLLAAGIAAATAQAHSMTQLMIALALLGLGWNFGLISGTALIVDATPLETRAKTQGSIHVLIALAGATGGAMSGVIVAGTSYAAMSLAGGILPLLLIPVVIWSQRTAPT